MRAQPRTQELFVLLFKFLLSSFCRRSEAKPSCTGVLRVENGTSYGEFFSIPRVVPERAVRSCNMNDIFNCHVKVRTKFLLKIYTLLLMNYFMHATLLANTFISRFYKREKGFGCSFLKCFLPSFLNLLDQPYYLCIS